MVELPLNGRDWASLATLQPGVTSVRDQYLSTGTSNRGQRGFGNALSDSGHRPNQNNYLYNGISIVDYANSPPGNTIGASLGVDAIQEFSVVTTNYSAEYGRASGAVINAIAKSGTNQFHGDVYEFLRNAALDARNYFDGAVIPPFRRNQFGASGGGPIKKNKAFFFADYEGIRQYQSLSLHDIVPTASARVGNLCSVPTTGTCKPNTIAVNPLVTPFLGFWPLPNAGLTPTGNGDTGFWNAAGFAQLSENYFTTRVDYKISDKDSLAGNYLRDRAPLEQTDSLVDVINAVNTIRDVGSLEENHIFSPALVNSARIGFNHFTGIVQKPVAALNPLADNPALGSFPGANAPNTTVTGLTAQNSAVNGAGFFNHTFNSFQFYDDLFLTRGTHSLKFGFATERMQNNELAHPTPNGTFTFSSLTNFLLDEPTSAAFVSSQLLHSEGNRQTLFGGYVQDDWRARPSLTLNLGLRYEMTTLPTEAHGGYGILQNLYSGFATFPVTHLWATNQTLRNFEPRIGFAWDPFRDGKTAIRGAFGIYDMLPLPATYAFNTADGYPFVIRDSITLTKQPPGTFPTVAYGLAGFSPSATTVSWDEQNPKRAYVMNWNLNVQRTLTGNTTLTVGYVGSHAVHQPNVTDDQNFVLPTTLTPEGYLWPLPVGSGAKLNPSVGAIRGLYWDSSATYEGLQTQVTKKMGHGVQAQASYTWGKCIDAGSSGGPVSDLYLNSLSTPQFFDPRARRGPCDFNLSQVFTANYIWQLPTPKFGGTAVSYLLGGWELGGIFNASTGQPFTLLMSGDPLGELNGDPNDYPDRVSGPGCANPVNPGDVNGYIKLNCFIPPTAPASLQSQCANFTGAVSPPPSGQVYCANLFGNNGRNSVYGPGLVDLDFSVYKNIPVPKISEAFNLQFRAELFNILNHTNFQSPINNETIFNQDGSPVAGAGALDATTTTSRQIQFALKVIW